MPSPASTPSLLGALLPRSLVVARAASSPLALVLVFLLFPHVCRRCGAHLPCCSLACFLPRAVGRLSSRSRARPLPRPLSPSPSFPCPHLHTLPSFFLLLCACLSGTAALVAFPLVASLASPCPAPCTLHTFPCRPLSRPSRSIHRCLSSRSPPSASLRASLSGIASPCFCACRSPFPFCMSLRTSSLPRLRALPFRPPSSVIRSISRAYANALPVRP